MYNNTRMLFRVGPTLFIKDLKEKTFKDSYMYSKNMKSLKSLKQISSLDNVLVNRQETNQ